MTIYCLTVRRSSCGFVFHFIYFLVYFIHHGISSFFSHFSLTLNFSTADHDPHRITLHLTLYSRTRHGLFEWLVIIQAYPLLALSKIPLRRMLRVTSYCEFLVISWCCRKNQQANHTAFYLQRMVPLAHCRMEFSKLKSCRYFNHVTTTRKST